MYVIFLFFSILSRAIKRDIVIVMLSILSIMGIGILAFNRGDSWLWTFLCWENLCKYLQFFTFGIIVAKYKDAFFDLIKKDWLITTLIAGWTVCMLLWYNDTFSAKLPLLYHMIHDIVARYCGLLTVITIFFCNAFFSGSSRTNNILKLIGRRTLDIYLIHFFFIPNLNFFSDWLNRGDLLVFQLTISLVITSIIIAICLGLSSVIRQSKALSGWLFGVKQTK